MVTYTTIDGLKEQMNAKRISLRVLEKRTGVSLYTIQRATQGVAISTFLAECIIQAVNESPVLNGHYRTGFHPREKGKYQDKKGEI